MVVTAFPTADSAVELTREQLLACLSVSQSLTAVLDPDELLGTIMETVSRLMPAETWSLLELDAATDTLRFRLCIDIDLETVSDLRLPLDRSVAGQAVRGGKRIVVPDVTECPFFYPAVDAATGHHTRSIISVPIRFAGRTLGVLELVNPKRTDNADLALLDLLSEYLAIAMENARRYHAIQEMADRDSLTGFYNQRYLYRQLDRWDAECRRSSRPLAMVFLDMDDFKRVVDAHGHLEGSRVLKAVAGILAGRLPATAVPVAYAGDEFLVVVPGCRRTEALDLAETLRSAIKSADIRTSSGDPLNLTASFGVAVIPDDAESPAALLDLADQAMFRGKKSGKDRVRRPGGSGG